MKSALHHKQAEATAKAVCDDRARRLAWKAYRLLCYNEPALMGDVKKLLLESIELQTQK